MYYLNYIHLTLISSNLDIKNVIKVKLLNISK